MGDAVEQNHIGIHNLGAIDPGTTILRHGKRQIISLQAGQSDIGQVGREDDVPDHVVTQHVLQRLNVGALENGANGLKRSVVGHKDGKVGDVELVRVVVAKVAKVVGQVGGAQGGVEVEQAVAAGEELQGGAETEGVVDLVDNDIVPDLDVLKEKAPSARERERERETKRG